MVVPYKRHVSEKLFNKKDVSWRHNETIKDTSVESRQST